MNLELTELAVLAISCLGHLVAFVWWASRLTARVDHVESWIKSNGHIENRLTAMETKLDLLLKNMRLE